MNDKTGPWRQRDDLDLIPLSGGPGEPPCSALRCSGRPTGLVLEGAWLEAAVSHAAGTLLFLTDDIPSEDFLHIHWVSPQWTLLDSARLGGPFSTGSFGSLTLHGADRLSFGFIGGIRWQLQLHAQPRWRWPWGGEAPGLWRRPGWRRWFTISGQPLPDVGQAAP